MTSTVSLKDAMRAVQAQMQIMRDLRKHQEQFCSGTGSAHVWVEQAGFVDNGWQTIGYACTECDVEV